MSDRGLAQLGVVYEDSKATALTLKSFYYLCVHSAAEGQGGASRYLMDCDVTLTAYRKMSGTSAPSLQNVCAQTFYYDPKDVEEGQQMAFSGPLSSCF